MKKQPKVWRRGAKALIIICVLFLVVYALSVMLSRSLRNLEYFKIKEILVSEGSADNFSYLKGRAIFAVDLCKESRSIARQFPAYKKVRIIRIFPHQLYVDFIKRNPVAYIKLYRYFYVDDEGMLLDVPIQPQTPELPVIEGLETKIFGARAGTQYRLPELAGALQILKEVSSGRLTPHLAISKIDAPNVTNLAFFMAAEDKPVAIKHSRPDGSLGLEVKLGSAGIEQKMDMLKGILAQLKDELWNIKYIDLRFREPVIKFKEKIANVQ